MAAKRTEKRIRQNLPPKRRQRLRQKQRRRSEKVVTTKQVLKFLANALTIGMAVLISI